MSPGPPRRPIGFATNLRNREKQHQELREGGGEEDLSSPLVIRLSDNYDGLAGLGLKLVGSLRIKVVLDDGVQAAGTRVG